MKAVDPVTADERAVFGIIKTTVGEDLEFGGLPLPEVEVPPPEVLFDAIAVTKKKAALTFTTQLSSGLTSPIHRSTSSH